MIVTPGNYKARAVGPVSFEKSSQQETPAALVQLRLEDGPHKGSTLEWKGWLTDKAKARTVESLVLMGFDGDDPASVQKNEVIAVCDNEPYDYTNDQGERKTGTRARISFINDPNRSVGFKPLDDAEREMIKGDIRAMVAAQKSAAPKDDLMEFPPKDGPKPKF